MEFLTKGEGQIHQTQQPQQTQQTINELNENPSSSSTILSTSSHPSSTVATTTIPTTTATSSSIIQSQQGDQQQANSDVIELRDPLTRPVHRLSVKLIDTYKHINKVNNKHKLTISLYLFSSF